MLPLGGGDGQRDVLRVLAIGPAEAGHYDSDMDDPVVRLGRLDACAVSDALDKLELAGVVTGLHRLTP